MEKDSRRKGRLDKLLSSLGYCSRSQLKKWLQEHEVLDGKQRLMCVNEKVDSHELRIDGEPLDHPDGICILMNKPEQMVCSHQSLEGPSVYDILPERWTRRNPPLQTVGRLDKDTSGALLITDDYQLIHQLAHPKKKISKCYEVWFKGILPSDAEQILARGDFYLDGEQRPCLPAHLHLIEPGFATLEIEEGRYHQVKRMFAKLGAHVEGLHRQRFGNWTVAEIPLGSWIEITHKM